METIVVLLFCSIFLQLTQKFGRFRQFCNFLLADIEICSFCLVPTVKTGDQRSISQPRQEDLCSQ